MPIIFHQEEEYQQLHMPADEAQLIQRKTEIRFDPLTRETARIVFDPGTKFNPPDYTEQAQHTEGQNCPFCPENVQRLTPLFPTDLLSAGRLVQGSAVLFPNLFPYSKHNAVAIFSEQHYVRLHEFTAELIANTFATAHQYLQNIAEKDAQLNYASINWNYLPQSGGSILHPHLHVIGSEQPTNTQALIEAKAQEFYAKHQQNYFLTLCSEEKKRQERWIAERDGLAWLHAFAPKGHYDFLGIFTTAPALTHLSDSSWQSLAQGLISFFSYFQEQGVASFNLSLYIPVHDTACNNVYVRLIPRLTLGALGTSDMNFFHSLHQEPLSYRLPEKVAVEARAFFEDV